jgi:hypothetical protein
MVPKQVVKILKITSDDVPSYHVGYIPHFLFGKYDPKYFEKIFLRA